MTTASCIQPEPPASRARPPRRAPSICFVSPKATGMLTGAADGHLGGAERQQALIARALADRGCRVSFVVWDDGRGDPEKIGNLVLYKTVRPGDGWPGLRFFTPRWTSLCAALQRADADVYYQRAAGAETGQVALWCRRRGRPMLFAAAASADCDAALPHLPARRERWLYRYGLRHAQRVIVQTCEQQEQLRSNFGLAAELIRSCTPDPLPSGEHPPAPAEANRVLWVGRLAPQKRPEWILQLAEALPAVQFEVVGPARAGDPYAERCAALLNERPNVVYHGRLAPAALSPLYVRNRVLLNTSPAEGYPNTFIEAWAHGRPVLASADPDGVISRNGLGEVAATIPALVAALQTQLACDEHWQQCAAQARRFYLEHHSVEQAVDAYLSLLRTLIDNGRESGAVNAQPGGSDRRPPRRQ